MRTLVATLSTLVLLTGCAASTSEPAPEKTQTVTAGFADNGRTVQLHLGDQVQVRLDSTYWQFAAMHGHVLRHVRTQVHSQPKAIPGSGAGEVTVTFQSDKLGIATITASRGMCGEAMRCVGKQGSFRMYVVVRGGK